MTKKTKIVRVIEKTYDKVSKFSNERGITMADAFRDAVDAYIDNAAKIGEAYKAYYKAKRIYNYIIDNPRGDMAQAVITTITKFLSEHDVFASVCFESSSDILELVVSDIKLQKTETLEFSQSDMTSLATHEMCVTIEPTFFEPHWENENRSFPKLNAAMFKAFMQNLNHA